MDSAGFDRLTHSFLHALSRRRLATALGLFASGTLHVTGAKNKKKRKKLKRNAFGCVNVGGHCRGRDNVCCSGICEGKKPKQGKKDKSKCRAHNVLNCPAGANSCLENVECGTNGFCFKPRARPASARARGTASPARRIRTARRWAFHRRGLHRVR
jgi:hypothetical protein